MTHGEEVLSRELLVVLAAPVVAERVVHLLDDATRGRLVGPRRDLRASAHALLRLVLTGLTGTEPRDHRLAVRCRTCGEAAHGKPVLEHPVLHVSLSASRTAVAVAVSGAAPVGVDVEQVDLAAFDGFTGVVLGAGEQADDAAARARAWTRKEAVLKATGHGLAVDPREVDVSRDQVHRPERAELLDVPSPAGTACSAAVLGARRPHLRVEERSLRD
jgi:4'-phosphopantetheinyl transferase